MLHHFFFMEGGVLVPTPLFRNENSLDENVKGHICKILLHVHVGGFGLVCMHVFSHVLVFNVQPKNLFRHILGI